MIRFVGIHNKPGYEPLDSSTKTGKIIDDIVKLVGVKALKCNLYPVDYRPTGQEACDFAKKFEVTGDFHILLGQHVSDMLSGKVFEGGVTQIRHPGYPMRMGKVEEYVMEVVGEIKAQLWFQEHNPNYHHDYE